MFDLARRRVKLSVLPALCLIWPCQADSRLDRYCKSSPWSMHLATHLERLLVRSGSPSDAGYFAILAERVGPMARSLCDRVRQNRGSWNDVALRSDRSSLIHTNVRRREWFVRRFMCCVVVEWLISSIRFLPQWNRCFVGSVLSPVSCLNFLYLNITRFYGISIAYLSKSVVGRLSLGSDFGCVLRLPQAVPQTYVFSREFIPADFIRHIASWLRPSSLGGVETSPRHFGRSG